MFISIRKSGPSTAEETESYKFSRDDWEEWIGSEEDLTIYLYFINTRSNILTISSTKE